MNSKAKIMILLRKPCW